MLTEESVRTALRKVKDPELDLNIVDLGLVYEIEIDGPHVLVRMTLTSPGCPSGPEIVGAAQISVEAIEGAGKVEVELIWSPYWTPERIDPKLRAYLGLG